VSLTYSHSPTKNCYKYYIQKGHILDNQDDDEDATTFERIPLSDVKTMAGIDMGSLRVLMMLAQEHASLTTVTVIMVEEEEEEMALNERELQQRWLLENPDRTSNQNAFFIFPENILNGSYV
jgi:hypothetical protein